MTAAESALLVADGLRILDEWLIVLDDQLQFVANTDGEELDMQFFRRGFAVAQLLMSLERSSERLQEMFPEEWPDDLIRSRLRELDGVGAHEDVFAYMEAVQGVVLEFRLAQQALYQRLALNVELPEYDPAELALDDESLRRLLDG